MLHTLVFEKEQIEPGWLVNKLGNTYSGSSPLGFTATLDIAKSGDKILHDSNFVFRYHTVYFGKLAQD